jgi:hypothetical protein
VKRSVKAVKASRTRKINLLRRIERLEAGWVVNHTPGGDKEVADRITGLRVGIERATQALRRRPHG